MPMHSAGGLQTPNLAGHRILIVEDEYLVAMDLALGLGDLGAEIIGPAGTVADAMTLLERFDGRLDGAVLDVNLRDERVYPVADALAAKGVRYVFASGYDVGLMPASYAHVPRCGKPANHIVIARLLVSAHPGL